MKRRILITGANGFIGGRVAEALDSRYLVRTAVRHSGAEVPGNLEFHVIGDLSEETDWSGILKGVKTVIHVAGKAHGPRRVSAATAREFDTVNHLATAHLAESCLAQGVEHLIFISSLHAVRSESEEPLREDSPCNPDSAYGKSKLAAEKALKYICEGGGLDYTVVRLPLVYGPQNIAGLAKLEKLIRLRIPIPLGAVENRRSFLAADNLCAFLELIIEAPEARNQTYHVSDGSILSTAEMVRRVAGVLGRKATIVSPRAEWVTKATQVPGMADLQRLTSSLCVDTTLAETRLGWKPPVSMEEGLRRAFGMEEEEKDEVKSQPSGLSF